jgi:GGDEF domain-containing protein
MISLKRYLDSSAGETYQRMLQLLADTAAQHPVDIDHRQCEGFKSEITRIQERFSAEANSEQLLVAAGTITQALATYNQAVSNFVRHQGAELQNMISMLTATIMSLGSASERSAKSLGAIEVQLKRASAVDDIRALRLRLEECLNQVRDEAARQRTETQVSIDSLKHELASSQHRLEHHGISSTTDPVTGLASRSAAEVAIHDAANAADTRYVMVAVLGKMQAINSRFGYAVGDELLCEFAARVVGRLCNHSHFYRWSGPSIIGVLQRTEPLHVIRTEISRVTEVPVCKSLASGLQNAFITTSAAWLVLEAAPPATDLIRKIDQFVTEQVPKEHN